ncbi:hypothetical protein GCM10011583_20880 [Streptomyces camponoticapitis]|uniref:FAD-binding PCMH-type domain-containing protein n=1 Tax=Streptomyces camponoticapitis TaxID=1616125 RepID=A0ABQ2E2A5_9ACTN|nr:hypothetical protein [Streptomyces camponoticapitis]GGJ89316.1 hypothetical protein GCM10011583_20880 [Streptomyces camponoticapitis]
MTATTVRALRLADTAEAADLAAFLGRLIRYDRAAAVRLQVGAGAVAVFGRPPALEVLAIRTARLREETAGVRLDVTVSAGELLESIDESTGAFALPAAVTGPPWTGVLPPRGGWRQVPGLPGPAALREAVAAAVAEFRTRDEALPAAHRDRAERDRIGREIWSRTVGDTGLPLRAVHAARSVGFLRPMPENAPVALLRAAAWMRLRTPYGSIAVRETGAGGIGALSVTPT